MKNFKLLAASVVTAVSMSVVAAPVEMTEGEMSVIVAGQVVWGSPTSTGTVRGQWAEYTITATTYTNCNRGGKGKDCDVSTETFTFYYSSKFNKYRNKPSGWTGSI